MNNKRLMLMADFAILLVALIWGATNVVIRYALSDITPFWFCALRFAIAWATVTLFFHKHASAMDLRTKTAGTLIGTVFICAYLVGASALLYTTAGNESFIISMSVVFVPLFVWILSRKFPGWHVLAAVVLCTAGTAGLVTGGKLSVNIGDLLSAAAMLFVTAYILLVQKFVANADPYGLACWQAFGGMLLAAAAAIIFEPFPAHLGHVALIAIVYAGTIGFALTLVLQTVAQKYTSPTHVAILLSTSAIFGSVLGIVCIGEPMTLRIFISSAVILAGVIMVEAVPALQRHCHSCEPRA